MASPAKRKVPGGRTSRPSSSRVTEKGTQPVGGGGTGANSTRPTIPTPQTYKESPAWVPILMFGLLAIGSLVIITNYLGILPGGTDSWYLVAGLGFILGGIITATQLH